MTLRQRIRFYQQLAVLARAGLSFRVSLERMKDRVPGREVTILSQKVNAGDRMSEAFEAAGFSAFECHLVAAGEKSAHLDTVFEHLSEFWKRELEMRQALMRPLYYPIAVFHLAILVGAIVKFAMTSWQVAAFQFVEQIVVLYFIGFVVISVVRASWGNEAMRSFWLWMPIVGNSLKTAYAYRWITALRLEFTAGITLSRAVGDAWRASGYVDCEQTATESEAALREGTVLSTLMVRWKQLPRDWVDFVETGEVSGALEAAFTNLEDEALRAWILAQQRMSDWLPKIVYFFVLLIAAAMVIQVYFQYFAGIATIEESIDNAMK